MKQVVYLTRILNEDVNHVNENLATPSAFSYPSLHHMAFLGPMQPLLARKLALLYSSSCLAPGNHFRTHAVEKNLWFARRNCVRSTRQCRTVRPRGRPPK